MLLFYVLCVFTHFTILHHYYVSAPAIDTISKGLERDLLKSAQIGSQKLG